MRLGPHLLVYSSERTGAGTRQGVPVSKCPRKLSLDEMWGGVMDGPGGEMQTLATPFVLRLYSPFAKLIVRWPLESVPADTARAKVLSPTLGGMWCSSHSSVHLR